MKYLPSPHAEELSEAIQQLSRPLSVRTADEVTFSRYAHVDGTDGVRYLVLDETDVLPVHGSADGAAVMAILSRVVSAEESAAIAAQIEAAKGGTLNVWDVVPQVLKDQARSPKEMFDAGLLPTPSMP